MSGGHQVEIVLGLNVENFKNLIQQLQELMPELAEVSPWHSVGQRRSLDEVGRIAEQPISDDALYGHDD